jgi:hypothetical protein
MPLQIRRGTAADRSGLTAPLAIGELLYVTDQGKLYIGDGTSIGSSDIVGNPGQGGKGLVITGFTAEDAQDATALLFGNGTHSNITFTYNDSAGSLSAQIDLSTYDGNITVVGVIDADFKGSVYADDSSLLVDAVDRKFFGDVEGNITGSVIGDIKGSIYADDSTLLVDAVSGTIPATVLTGTFTGNVIGNVTGDLTGNTTGVHTGNVVTGFIQSSDSSSIIIESPAVFQTNVDIQSDLRVSGNLVVLETMVAGSNNSSGTLLKLENSHDVQLSSQNMALSRSRNTYQSPAAVQSGDQIFRIIFEGHDGSGYVQSSQIRADVDENLGSVSTGIVPGNLQFWTMGTGGSLERRLEIDAGSKTSAFGQLYAVSENISGVAQVFNVQSHHDSGAAGTRATLRRSRGTFLSQTAVQNGDTVVRLMWGGYDGSTYRDTASIEGNVAAAVSSGIVPIDLTFKTQTALGVINTAAKITIDQKFQVNTIETLSGESVNFDSAVRLPVFADPTARDAAITSPAAGMMVFVTDSTGAGGPARFQGYVDGISGWVDLN